MAAPGSFVFLSQSSHNKPSIRTQVGEASTGSEEASADKDWKHEVGKGEWTAAGIRRGRAAAAARHVLAAVLDSVASSVTASSSSRSVHH